MIAEIYRRYSLRAYCGNSIYPSIITNDIVLDITLIELYVLYVEAESHIFIILVHMISIFW